MPSAHIDTFARDHLPPPEAQPEYLFDLPELQFPAQLNCATALLDIEVVAIGGGFSSVVPDYAELVAAPIAESEFPFVRSVTVVRSGLSGDGPLIGAAGFVLRPEMVG